MNPYPHHLVLSDVAGPPRDPDIYLLVAERHLPWILSKVMVLQGRRLRLTPCLPKHHLNRFPIADLYRAFNEGGAFFARDMQMPSLLPPEVEVVWADAYPAPPPWLVGSIDDIAATWILSTQAPFFLAKVPDSARGPDDLECHAADTLSVYDPPRPATFPPWAWIQHAWDVYQAHVDRHRLS